MIEGVYGVVGSVCLVSAELSTLDSLLLGGGRPVHFHLYLRLNVVALGLIFCSLFVAFCSSCLLAVTA